MTILIFAQAATRWSIGFFLNCLKDLEVQFLKNYGVYGMEYIC